MSELTLNMQTKGLIKMLLETNNYTAVDIVRDLQKRIASLDRQSEKFRDDIASWQRVHRAEYEKREALDARIVELEQQLKTAKADGVREFAVVYEFCNPNEWINHALDYANNLEGK